MTRYPILIKSALSLFAMGLSSQSVNACTICEDVAQYGSSVAESITSSGDSIVSTTETVAKNYADTAKALLESGDRIVSAINASSNTVSAELLRSGESRARLLEALKTSIEQLEKSKFIAETNKEVAQTFGAENIPVELCEAFGRAEARELATETARRLVKENEERQIQERYEENRTQITDPFSSNAVSISALEFSEDEAKIAMEQASILTGERSFPVSPDVIMNIATRGGGGSDQAMQVMSGWIRSSNASQDLASQISKRTKPNDKSEGSTTDSLSLMGDLWEDVKNGIEQDAAIQDASSTKAALLRTIARRGAVSNKIKLEQLEVKLALARMNASQIGYLNEQAIGKLKPYLNSQAAKSAVERGNE